MASCQYSAFTSSNPLHPWGTHEQDAQGTYQGLDAMSSLHKMIVLCEALSVCRSLAGGRAVTLTEAGVQNVKPEKLFTKERAIKQLLDIIDNATMKDTGRFIAWDGQDIPW